MNHEWIGLTLGFVSALLANTAYSLEHDAAAALPPLSPRHPLQSARLLLRARQWLTAFAAETAGWLMYVVALRLAPLALVQAIGASGVGVLAFATARGHPSRLALRERFAVVLAFAGLLLLALSIIGRQELDHRPSAVGVIIWLAAAAGAAVFLIVQPTRSARAASLGLASGLLLSDGDISAKLIGYRGPWLIALVSLIVAYSIGSIVLQSAYQRGDALTAAGTSTIVTSGVPSWPGSCSSARHCRTGYRPLRRSPHSHVWYSALSRSNTRRRLASASRFHRQADCNPSHGSSTGWSWRYHEPPSSMNFVGHLCGPGSRLPSGQACRGPPACPASSVRANVRVQAGISEAADALF